MSRSSSNQRGFRSRIDALGFSGSNILAIAGVDAYYDGHEQAKIHCPAPDHEDRNPSCTVNLETGQAHCFKCKWSSGDILNLHMALTGITAPGVALQELESHRDAAIPTLQVGPAWRGKSTNGGAQPEGKPITTGSWNYTTADGAPAFMVVRTEFQDAQGQTITRSGSGKPVKSFSQRHPDGTPGLPAAFKNGLRPMYRLKELENTPADEVIIVVEGEKAADALIERGVCATTSSGGASQAHLTDWQPLAGRPALLWPDNDEAGRNHMATVAGLLLRLEPPACVEFVDVSGLDLPPGGDAADYLARREP